MAKVKIYGCSDDLIEVEGDIREEFSKFETSLERPVLLGFSDGTVLKVYYGEDGIWHINKEISGTCTVTHEPARDPNGRDYSDEVTLEGQDIDWVVFGTAMAQVGVRG